MKEELEELQKRAILKVSNWWGLRYAGYAGTIVTSDKELYEYQYYHVLPKELEEKEANFIVKRKELNDKEFEEIINFIENEVISKEYEKFHIFDAGYNVAVNYKGVNKTVINNKGFDKEIKLYDKAKQLINKIKNNI